MKISLCMIVKNESENLLKCLNSVDGIVDEIIIVDTGSSDNTKVIASGFTSKIYDFDWCDDFSEARNFAISKSNNDWILTLDADERVVEFNEPEFKYFEIKKSTIGRIKIINIIEDQDGIRKKNDFVSRFFNKRYFKYEGIIHEQLVPKDEVEYQTENIKITVEHVGYTTKVIQKTGKIERNITLLKREIEKYPTDPYFYYQLGKTYFLDKQYSLASKEFKRAVELSPNTSYEYVEDLIITYGYALINSGKYLEALELRQFEDFYNDIADFNFLMGLIYMNNEMFNDSVKTFLKCTKNTKSSIEGITSYMAYYNIGVIFECLGYKDEALTFYGKCCDYQPAVARIFDLK